MQPINSTYEILVSKALNRDIDSAWVTWAIDMLVAGFDTDNLKILAGENPPFNQFEMQKLTDKVLKELQLDYSDKERTVKKYAIYLIDQALAGQIDSLKVLKILEEICVELDYEKYLFDFYKLYFAKEDLLLSVDQWYWKGATRENIDQIIADYFKKWKSENQQD